MKTGPEKKAPVKKQTDNSSAAKKQAPKPSAARRPATQAASAKALAKPETEGKPATESKPDTEVQPKPKAKADTKSGPKKSRAASLPVVLINAKYRALVEPHLPASVEARWFNSAQEAIALAPQADMAWFEIRPVADEIRALNAATRLKWMYTLMAGVEALPLAEMAARGIRLTNGSGISDVPVSEFCVMSMLAAAKGLPFIVHAADRHQWLTTPAGCGELFKSSALIVGYGHIGKEIARRLKGFGVKVTGVTHKPGRDELGPKAWRDHLGEFDWVILMLPGSPENRGTIGADELARMKSSAWLVNMARGTLVDTDALVDALQRKAIAGAILDSTDPEPLPADHPLWNCGNALISMHLSGPSTRRADERASKAFLKNLKALLKGKPLPVEFALPKKGKGA